MYNIKLKSTPRGLLHHFILIAPNFSCSPKEFYSSVEQLLTERRFPDLEVSRIEHTEGGLLSNHRTYLHIMRERLAFETCAAPFGTDFFFSCRAIWSPAEIRFWHVLVLAAFLYLVYYPLAQLLGITFATIAVVALIAAVVQVFRNVNQSKFSDLDRLLLKIPALGPFYDRWFRKETFYREDTRLVYLASVPDLILGLVEEITAAHGVRLVRHYEYAPIFGDFYTLKPSQPSEEHELSSPKAG